MTDDERLAIHNDVVINKMSSDDARLKYRVSDATIRHSVEVVEGAKVSFKMNDGDGKLYYKGHQSRPLIERPRRERRAKSQNGACPDTPELPMNGETAASGLPMAKRKPVEKQATPTIAAKRDEIHRCMSCGSTHVKTYRAV